VALLTAAFLGWLFDGYEIGLFPSWRPALKDLLAGASDGQIGQWMGSSGVFPHRCGIGRLCLAGSATASGE
jgi:hypothetical protein